ncbi:MAG: hypothetical protein ABIE92_02325 [bacterium]
MSESRYVSTRFADARPENPDMGCREVRVRAVFCEDGVHARDILPAAADFVGSCPGHPADLRGGEGGSGEVMRLYRDEA